MRKQKWIIVICFFLTTCVFLRAQQDAYGEDRSIGVDDDSKEILRIVEAIQDFSIHIPHEKVYLHFDNTSYFQGDNIWFKCYVVTSGSLQSSRLSKTLYVELLNPGGEIIEKRILKIENGQCHGEFTLSHLPFYSGFYEVRAYTKYMLNFGDDVIFSRLMPVYNKPKKDGDYEEKKMLRYNKYGPAGNYPMKRKSPSKGNKVNVRFFPEGGNLIQGIKSRVAFEATDETGNPIDVTGIITDGSKQEVCKFATAHEGKGVFPYTPMDDIGKTVAEVEYDGKKYRFDLPKSRKQGVVMKVDNLTNPDSIVITLQRNGEMPPELLGIAVVCGDRPQPAFFALLNDQETSFKMSKRDLPAGVSQIVLFNRTGEILSDRLVFTGMKDRLTIKTSTDKAIYSPHELVEMNISITDSQTKPVNTTFSLSVRDGAHEVDGNQNIMTDLLLMSDIKGFVRNPSLYFEQKKDSADILLAAFRLDLLLMVQGWRRHSWKQTAGVEPSELKYLPEQGIEMHGTVVSSVREKPKENVAVSLFLRQKGEETEAGESAYESFITDEQGRFSFITEVQGKWNMILSVMEKNKKKDHLIILDRVFTPAPGNYRYADLQVRITGENGNRPVEAISDDETEVDFESSIAASQDSIEASQDSIAKSGIDKIIHRLPEVKVKAKRRTKEQEIFRSRSTSIAYYDVASEVDNIYDRGDYIGDNIHRLLKNLNKDFVVGRLIPKNTDELSEYKEFVYYRGKPALIVVDYEPNRMNISDDIRYRTLRLSAIKSIYINENTSVMAHYIISRDGRTPFEIARDDYRCAIFIETYPEGKIPAKRGKGVRKTHLEGYSAVKEFYSPNYAELPPEPDTDYRRTLYWNPLAATDETGSAKIKFYNNSSCVRFSISAETITPQGITGVLQR